MTGSALRVGIHDLAFATAHQVLDLGALAEHNGVDANKYYIGIGQTEMSVPAADEDIVTMGAQAAVWASTPTADWNSLMAASKSEDE
jgi:3-hydroxy-3-methylglutaryl CoA synthase